MADREYLSIPPTQTAVWNQVSHLCRRIHDKHKTFPSLSASPLPPSNLFFNTFFFFCRPAIAHALVFNTHCRFRGQGDNSNVGELGFWPKNLILSSVETRSKSCAKQGGNHHAYARIGFYLKITALPNMATIQPDRKGVCPMTTLIVSFRLLINPSPSLSNHPHGRIIHFQVFIPSPFIINSLASGPLLSATLLCHVEEIAVS